MAALPNFIAEIKFESDRRAVEVYRAGAEPRILTNINRIDGDGPFEGFTLDLKTAWDPITRHSALCTRIPLMTQTSGSEAFPDASRTFDQAYNGKSRKTLKGDAGEMTIEVPRDRNGTFEPQLIGKHQTRFEGFDAKILSMYGLGMTVRDIQGHLHDMYGVDVSSGLISEVTDGIQEEVQAWQDRPLEALYPIIYLDSAIKLLYLALRNVSKKWTTVQGWPQALQQFTIRWGDRIEAVGRT